MLDIKYYIVDECRWRIVASAEDEDEAWSKRDRLQRDADEWNYDNPHKTPRYYTVMSVEQYYRWGY